MTKIAVITGDLVNSTQVSTPDKFRSTLKKTLTTTEERYDAIATTHRGDGFQVTMPQQANAFNAVLLIRAALISHSPDKGNRWDARMAIAFGEGKATIDDQNSDVYVNSGRTLDGMKNECLAVYSDEELKALAYGTATAFADNLIKQWTLVEAEVIYHYLKEDANHERIAQILDKKRPTITQALNRAKYGLIDLYIENMNKVANHHD